MSGEIPRADVDSAKAEAFAGRFLTALNSGALCLMASVGHRTGLFDVMSTLPPATSDEIAARANPMASTDRSMPTNLLCGYSSASRFMM